MSPSFRAKLDSADHVENFNKEKDPSVKISGYLYDFNNEVALSSTGSLGQKFGFSSQLAADIFASLHSPAFRVTTANENYLVFNPHLFGEASLW